MKNVKDIDAFKEKKVTNVKQVGSISMNEKVGRMLEMIDCLDGFELNVSRKRRMLLVIHQPRDHKL